MLNDTPNGTTRLDNFNNGYGVVRLVAISDNFQKSVHGRQLSSLIENYARHLGIKTLYVNADPEALEFYKKLGWEFCEWDVKGLNSIAEDGKQMQKFLSS